MNNREIKQAKLLETATQLFSEKGFAATTIKDISVALGWNQAMIYYYYPDKQALLYESIASGMKRLINNAKRIARMKIPIEEKLELLIREHINYISYDAATQAIANSEIRHLTPLNRRKYIEKRDKYEKLYRNIIEEGMQHGKYRQADAKILGIFILQLVNSVTRWYRKDGKYTLNHISGMVAEFINKGIST